MNQEQLEDALPLIAERDALRALKTAIEAGTGCFRFTDEASDNGTVRTFASEKVQDFTELATGTGFVKSIDDRITEIATALAALDYVEDETPE